MEELNQHLKSFIDEIYKPELWEKTAIPKSECMYDLIFLNTNVDFFLYNMQITL